MPRTLNRRAGALVILALALTAVATPIAVGAGEGEPVEGGVRNPGANQTQELRGETEIIARNGTYGTRQSNKGSGGGAIYGCRARRLAEEPCIRANNLNDGRAFEFETNGPVAGSIDVGDPRNQPFSTNARGRVENLNADRVDNTHVVPIAARVVPGEPPQQLTSRDTSLVVLLSCEGGDVLVRAATDDDNAIIHSIAHGVSEGQTTSEAKDDDFDAGETFVTGFDQSHSGSIHYVDDDETVTIDLSTDEQGGTPATCIAFGSSREAAQPLA